MYFTLSPSYSFGAVTAGDFPLLFKYSIARDK